MIVPSLERVKIFCSVRDLPYRIGTGPGDEDRSCATKTPKLQAALEQAGLTTRPRFCRFFWRDLPIPSEIRDQAPFPEAGHEYLELLVPEKDQWIQLDPTWDRSLEALNFPIAEWDGVTSTRLAVTPSLVFGPDESARRIETNQTLGEAPPRDWQMYYLQHFKPFFDTLNLWLEQGRRRGGQYRSEPTN